MYVCTLILAVTAVSARSILFLCPFFFFLRRFCDFANLQIAARISPVQSGGGGDGDDDDDDVVASFLGLSKRAATDHVTGSDRRRSLN